LFARADALPCVRYPSAPAAAVVAGNSIGGFMAANLAGTRPELVRALVLVNSAGPLTEGATAADVALVPPPRAPPPPLLINAVTAALLFYLERNIPATLKKCYPTAPERADDVIAAEIFRAACDGGAFAVFASVFYLPKPPALNALVAAFGKRTLVLQGALDPLNDSKKRAADLARLCPANATVQLLQAGHCPHDELPGEWNAAVAQLLAELS
jgi:pimeloyl-ACP methyl ester carboxylesterase